VLLVQALGETGTVLSEDSDSDVRVEIAGHVWTFNPSCCTRLPPTTSTKPSDKKPRSDESSEATSDDDDDDDGEQQIIGSFVLQFCFHD